MHISVSGPYVDVPGPGGWMLYAHLVEGQTEQPTFYTNIYIDFPTSVAP